MFDDVSDAGLIDGIGAASRAESAAMARRLALIGELDARRAVELVERRWWRVDPFLEVAAEVAAALNISRSRVGDQIHLARVLRDELPAVAAVFATGAIDYRMVDTIISRTDNVEFDRKPAVDAAIARHCVKWMRLSKPKLRDRVDLWVAKHDPAAVRVPPKVDDSRYIEVGETSAGMAGIWANVRSSDAAVLTGGWRRWRPPCVIWIRAPNSSAAPMRWGRWPAARTPWPASAGHPTARRVPNARLSARS